MGRKVDKEVRTDEVLLSKEDHVAYNIVYYGRTEIIGSADSDEVWQIKRITSTAGVKKVEYANHGKYNLKWSDRYSYFSPDPAPEPAPSLGTITISGLTVAGRITEVPLNDSSWTALPAIALGARNQINIQNDLTFDMKLNYSAATVGYVGIKIASGSERQYAITPTIVLYGKLEPGGSGSITIEELA